MGPSHHDQVRQILREARLAILRLLRRPAWVIGSDRPVFPGNGQTLRDAFDPNPTCTEPLIRKREDRQAMAKRSQARLFNSPRLR
jgi:hypothetical protein